MPFISLITSFSLLALGIFSSPVLASHISAPSGYVNDFAGVLSSEEKGALETKLQMYRDQSGNEIAVALVKSLNGGEIDDFTVRVFEEWKIGSKDMDNGLLFLAAIEDRKMRIEVGYGLEGYLTDGQAGVIIRDVVSPAFKTGNYYGGIDAGLTSIISNLSGAPTDSIIKGAGSVWEFLLNIFAIFGDAAVALALLVLLTPFVYLFSFLARTKSFWLGGVGGAGLGLAIGGLIGSLWAIFIIGFLLGGIGLLLDWALSRNYQKLKKAGKKTDWWTTGGGFWLGGSGSGGGGFGGFGGGGSGGGGSSGSW